MSGILLDTRGPGGDRTKFLGGSDVAAALGMSAWETRYSLWEEKTHRAGPDITIGKEKLFKRGKRWEQPAFEMLVDLLEDEGHEVELVGSSRRYQDSQYAFMQCEIDREIILDGEDCNIELKATHGFAGEGWGEMWTDEIPIQYGIQVSYGQGINGARRTIIGRLVSSDNIVPYQILRDDEEIERIRARACDFWYKHVVADKPPEPVNMSDIIKIFGKRNGRPVFLSDEEFENLCTIRKIRWDIRAWEAEKEARTFDFCMAIRRQWGLDPLQDVVDNAVLMHGIREVGSWKRSIRMDIDMDALRREMPEVVGRFTEEKSTRILNIK